MVKTTDEQIAHERSRRHSRDGHEMANDDLRRNAQWRADKPSRAQAEKWFHHGLSPKGTSVNSQGCKPLETVELVT
jgi:hypothetical protein